MHRAEMHRVEMHRGDAVTAREAEMQPCPCGNQTHTGGFYPCKLEGDLRPTWAECEPDSDWSGHYACADCGRISTIEGGE